MNTVNEIGFESNGIHILKAFRTLHACNQPHDAKKSKGRNLNYPHVVELCTTFDFLCISTGMAVGYCFH